MALCSALNAPATSWQVPSHKTGLKKASGAVVPLLDTEPALEARSCLQCRQISGSEHYTVLLGSPVLDIFYLYTVTGEMANKKV